MFKKWVSSLFLAGLLVASAGCAAGAQTSATPTPLPQLARSQNVVFTVERGPIVSQLDVSGDIVPELPVDPTDPTSPIGAGTPTA